MVNHIVGCGIGCLLAHFAQSAIQKFLERKDLPVEQSKQAIKMPRAKAYTTGGKIKPRVHSDQHAFLKEQDH